MERTLLSAAVDVDFELTQKVKINPSVKCRGQECPRHNKNLLRSQFVAQRLPQRGLTLRTQLDSA